MTIAEPPAPSRLARRHLMGGLVAALVSAVTAACSSTSGPVPPPDDKAYACADGRVVRFLEEPRWDRAVLTTTTEQVTLLRAEDDTGGERFVTRTGWEFRINDDQALLTSPGREQTYCRRARVRWR